MVTESETETKKERVATHALLLADGTTSDDVGEEQATGISYALRDHPETFVWQYGEATDDERRMLACFGAKTLATNETSGVRNSKQWKDQDHSASVAEQWAALVDRFKLIRSGTWADRTREPGAPRVNLDALAEAISRVMVAQGKRTQAEIDSGGKAEYRERLESKEYLAKVRTVPAIAAEYSAIIGKATATLDDVA